MTAWAVFVRDRGWPGRVPGLARCASPGLALCGPAPARLWAWRRPGRCRWLRSAMRCGDGARVLEWRPVGGPPPRPRPSGRAGSPVWLSLKTRLSRRLVGWAERGPPDLTLDPVTDPLPSASAPEPHHSHSPLTARHARAATHSPSRKSSAALLDCIKWLSTTRVTRSVLDLVWPIVTKTTDAGVFGQAGGLDTLIWRAEWIESFQPLPNSQTLRLQGLRIRAPRKEFADLHANVSSEFVLALPSQHPRLNSRLFQDILMLLGPFPPGAQ